MYAGGKIGLSRFLIHTALDMITPAAKTIHTFLKTVPRFLWTVSSAV